MRSANFAEVMTDWFKLRLKIMDASVAQPNHLLPQVIDGDLGIGRTNEQSPFTQSLELCIALRVGAVRHFGRDHRGITT